MGKNIFRKSEKKWKCAYCGFLNDLSEKRCGGCGAARTGSEETTNILTDYEEVERISYDEFDELDQHHPKAFKLTNFIVIQFFIVICAIIIISSITTTFDNEEVKVLSKQWSYTAYIADNVTKTGIVSYNKPPAGATNIAIEQVMQENGWYKTKYTYDFTGREIVRVVPVKGTENLPTFKEVSISGTETIDNCSVAEFTVTVEGNDGPVTISTTKDIWIAIQVNESYSLDKIKR